HCSLFSTLCCSCLSTFCSSTLTATSFIHTLSLHDALPIWAVRGAELERGAVFGGAELDALLTVGVVDVDLVAGAGADDVALAVADRKSTRLNSSHVKISYAVFCLKKKKINTRVSNS